MTKTITGEDLHKALQILNDQNVPGPHSFYEVQEAFEYLVGPPKSKIVMSTRTGQPLKSMPRYEVKGK